MDTHYLLGVVPRVARVDVPFAGELIIYTPPNSGLSQDALIGFHEPSARGDGGSANAATWLARNAEHWRPGWIELALTAANCSWLVPMLHRLAAKENVPLKEIQAAYIAQNGGRVMPSGTIYELIDFVNRGTVADETTSC